VRDLLDALASKVDDKGQELSQSHQRLDQLEREQERVQERARILRDMHDGVGSHISSAIRQLQSGHANHDEVLLTLRDSLDQLKLSIDALNLSPGDVTALLANLRYRLEPRFRSMGLALEWALVPLPELSYLDASAMRQLQYIFFEALSNVMQHAHASVLRIEATPVLPTQGGAQHRVRIRICDNGRGFDASAVRRKGLVAMQARAQAIGAQVSVSSHPGETVVEILLA
jgi:signal transduction histidine kinase